MKWEKYGVVLIDDKLRWNKLKWYEYLKVIQSIMWDKYY